MIKAIIFDLDGVLIDNTDEIVDIFKETARRCRIKIPSRKKVVDVLGMIGFEMIDRALGKDPLYKKVNYQVWDEREAKMRLMTGVGLFLKNTTLKKGVATSRSNASLRRSLGGLTRQFKVIVGREDVAKHKPDPEPLLAACRRLRVKPAEAVYVGDALIDLKAAMRAKTNFIAMLSGAAGKNAFKKAGTKYFIKSFSELPKILKKI